ncbi:PREDICTED: uncharacterized protein LOC104591030 isoform X6 [Nelumbo nucifera]|nr:PREDICTED: uncharacterized protein LOC104591030 isoform X6 [Nelumbo nucifera]
MAFGHNGSTQLAVKIKGVDSTGNGDQVRIIHRGAKYNHLNDIDYFGNNMLHLAAELSPYKQLSRVSGAALQMQRELQWFKEVEKFIPPKHRESRNNNGKTPQALFTEEHKDLVKEGEKWMKDTAQS